MTKSHVQYHSQILTKMTIESQSGIKLRLGCHISSASHQAPNYVQRSYISQNILKRCIAVAMRLVYFFNLLETSTVALKDNSGLIDFKKLRAMSACTSAIPVSTR